MQAIRDRVEDGKALWAVGRIEGGFLCVLVAVAAKARQSYPLTSGTTDREAFERFLTDHFPWRLEGGVGAKGNKRRWPLRRPRSSSAGGFRRLSTSSTNGSGASLSTRAGSQ